MKVGLWCVLDGAVRLAQLPAVKRLEAVSNGLDGPYLKWVLVAVSAAGVVAYLVFVTIRLLRRRRARVTRWRQFLGKCRSLRLTEAEAGTLWTIAQAGSPESPEGVLADKALFEWGVRSTASGAAALGDLAGIREKLHFPAVLPEMAGAQAGALGTDAFQWEFDAQIVDVMDDCVRLTQSQIDGERLRRGVASESVLFAELPSRFFDIEESDFHFERAGVTDVFRHKLRLASVNEPDERREVLLRVDLGQERAPLWLVGHVRGLKKEDG